MIWFLVVDFQAKMYSLNMHNLNTLNIFCFLSVLSPRRQYGPSSFPGGDGGAVLSLASHPVYPDVAAVGCEDTLENGRSCKVSKMSNVWKVFQEHS